MTEEWLNTDADTLLKMATEIRQLEDVVSRAEEVMCLYYLCYKKGSAQGAFGMANVYEKIIGGDYGNTKAVYWYDQACLLNDKISCVYLGMAYQFGHIGLEPNQEKAASYFKKADMLEEKGSD